MKRGLDAAYSDVVAIRDIAHNNDCTGTNMRLSVNNNGAGESESESSRIHYIVSLTGGLSKAADDLEGDYYEQFTLDYGKQDTERSAGSLRGFLKYGALSKLPENDPFKKWLNHHLEKGPEEIKGRIKPFYAADFGSKADLNKTLFFRISVCA